MKSKTSLCIFNLIGLFFINVNILLALEYEIIDLGTLGGDSYAYGINNNG